MIVAIVGSRDGIEFEVVRRFVSKLAIKYPEATVVSGGARGVDTHAETAADHYDLGVISYRPEEGEQRQGARIFGVARFEDGVRITAIEGMSYTSYGQAAYARNGLIVQDADVLVAFTTGSRGTANSIELAKAKGIPVFVYGPDGSLTA